ncbi:MAG: hypothetical protein GF317_06260 [Candidatus Lokiarchaeota archaeon]|nr:hypothetical protein [Candidatus Lokiarchaeota archaeon]MBD3199325.1 hypothetical protein [Candidatus Lokiarchaeota archaeon]
MGIEKYDIFYISGLVISAIFMIVLMFLGVNILTFSQLIFFWVMKFLSGFGLILTVTNIFLVVLNLFKNKIEKEQVRAFIIIQIIIPAILIIYSIYRIVSNYQSPYKSEIGIMWWINVLLFVFGIVSLTLSLYVLPLIREEFEDAAKAGILTKAKRGAKGVGRKIKKKYFSFRKKYAQMEIQDETSIKEILTIWRMKFAIYLLIPIGIGSIIFTPVTFVCIVFWIKIFIIDEDAKMYERIALLLSMIWVATIASLSYTFDWIFYTAIANYFWTIDIFYLIGIVVATLIFIRKLAQLKGITLKDVKERISEIGDSEEQ